MGDSAMNLRADHLTVEGFEHVLEAVDTGGDLSSGDIMPPGDQPGDMWTLDETTRKLGVTKRTVLRKLKNGELVGHKVPGPFGQEWRIYPNHQGGDNADDLSSGKTLPPDREMSSHDTNLVNELRRQVTELKFENISLQKELQGASYRNGYLESQLQEREREVKLLTDGEHKRGYWSRIRAFFRSV